MDKKNFPQQVKKFEVEIYQRPKNIRELRKTHVAFSGSPLNHPYSSHKVVLVPDPYGGAPLYYEFKNDDIDYAEKLPSIVNGFGETVHMVRLWVKKRSTGMLCTPFIVEEAEPEEILKE
jgi:inorganic pyrophosphatase